MCGIVGICNLGAEREVSPGAIQRMLGAVVHRGPDEAGVYLDDGYIFGPEGGGFQRINIACPRSILSEALKRIKEAVDQLP